MSPGLSSARGSLKNLNLLCTLCGPFEVFDYWKFDSALNVIWVSDNGICAKK